MKNDTKTIIVTGASSGIGYNIALTLVSLNHTVIIICRDYERGIDTKNKLSAYGNPASVHLYIADLSSHQQIKDVCENIKKSFSHIDVLINNAGCNYSQYTLNEDNIEMQFSVNYLSGFLLAYYLLSPLNKALNGRIINITSRAHARGGLNLDNLNYTGNYSGMKAYNQSKLAQILFTYELSKRLANTHITVNCMHPGLVNTSIGNKNATPAHNLIWNLMKKLGKSPKKAADTAIFLATDDSLKNTTGKYFANRKQIRSSKKSYEKSLSEELWIKTEQITGIRFKT